MRCHSWQILSPTHGWVAGQGAADLQTDEICEAMLRAIEAVHAAYTSATQNAPTVPVKSAKGAAKPSNRGKAAAQEPVLLQPLQACSCPAIARRVKMCVTHVILLTDGCSDDWPLTS